VFWLTGSPVFGITWTARSMAGKPYAILDDVTVFGLSLPKAWLGGLKGENLIGQAMSERNGSPPFRGTKSLRVEPGALVLEAEN